MIYLVEMDTNKIIGRCDAWLAGGEERLIQKAEELGYTVVNEEITMMGNMVIYVTR